MDEIQASHAQTATTINIGDSFEGRPLKVMKISTNDANPAVFIEANIHAREWISRWMFLLLFYGILCHLILFHLDILFYLIFYRFLAQLLYG